MTDKNQKWDQPNNIENILKDHHGKELGQELIASLEAQDKYSIQATFKPPPIISLRTVSLRTEDALDALKKIPTPKKYPAKIPTERIEALKIVYTDLVTNKISKDFEYWPADLWIFSKKALGLKIRKKDNYFLAWLLIQTADFDKKKCKKPIRNNWRIACDLMELITSNSKFIKDHESEDKRKKLYLTIKKYIKIVLEAATLKYRYDSRLEKLIERDNFLKDPPLQYLKEAIKLEYRYGYDLNLAHSIHNFLIKCEQKQKNPVRIGDIYDHFSNKRKNDIYPCLGFLGRIGEIFVNKKSKEIYYIGDGQDLKELCPSVFPDFFRSELSSGYYKPHIP